MKTNSLDVIFRGALLLHAVMLVPPPPALAKALEAFAALTVGLHRIGLELRGRGRVLRAEHEVVVARERVPGV